MGPVRAWHKIQLITKVGNIDFTAPKDISAKLQANTKVGAIDSEFPLDIEKTSITARTAKGTVGSGESKIKLTTEVGKIHIKKQSQTLSSRLPSTFWDYSQ